MRSILVALMSLLALAVWTSPVSARRTESPAQSPPVDVGPVDELGPNLLLQEGRPVRPSPMSVGGGNGGAQSASHTFGGARLRQRGTDSVYMLYPGACYERSAGTWAPKTTPIADSLNTYSVGWTGPYQQVDRSIQERLWRITDIATDPAQRPSILHGSRSLWCGKFDAHWTGPGYSNQTMQLLYIDTGAHSAPYTLSFMMELSSEYQYDFVHVIGGGGSDVDPLGNSRVAIDEIISTGHLADSDLLVTWTGSVRTGGTVDVGAPPVGPLTGTTWGEPTPVTVSLTNVKATHRAIYIVFTSDEAWSHEDGYWPCGKGQVLDRIQTSDHGLIYDDQIQSMMPDPPFEPYTDASEGDVLVGTDVAPIISARVAPGTGALWHLVSGVTTPTGDLCAVQKMSNSDLILSPADPTTSLTIPGTWAEIQTCVMPLPANAYRVDILSNAYLNLSGFDGYVEADIRWHQNGVWTNWGSLSVTSRWAGRYEAWLPGVGTWSAQLYGADSVQARFEIKLTATANAVAYGALIDDLMLKVYTGSPRPIIWGYNIPQSTFIDGTMLGLNCSVAPCWPGILGTEVVGGIDDNVNSGGDKIAMLFDVGLRPNGMGANWKVGHGSASMGGVEPQYVNASFNPAYDAPRMIYRLFDPATLSWSPFDSTVLSAYVRIFGADTLVDVSYETDWPPPDKVASGASLPGNFTIDGRTLYSDLRYLPRGTKLQYYWKAVDILGNTDYQFGWAGEIEDLPLLPNSSNRAQDVFEFEVLPRKYPPGTPGTLLAGQTDTPILNLDSGYLRWQAWGATSSDPVTQALRGLGVRADRYRLVGSLIGGHKLGDTQWVAGSWPNMEEYGLLDLLASQYRIIIEPTNNVIGGPFDEQTAKLLHAWWDMNTGANSGDRCIFTSGDDIFSAIQRSTTNNTERFSLMSDVFGVADAARTWSGAGSNAYPNMDDRFAGGGPGLAAPGAFSYPLDGGCPNVRKFNGLTKITSADAQNAVAYPGGVSHVAGVSRMSEMDPVADTDRNKALSHAYGIERVRSTGIPITAPNYVHSGVQNRMRVLYKFLTSCRGARNTVMQCWPCPGSAGEMMSNWATATGFQTETYGPLYSIQDFATATPVDVFDAPRWVNRLQGNFPNPFNPQTTIRYTAATRGTVTIRIFDVAGRLVKTLVKRAEESGPGEMLWDGKTVDGRQVSSGIYFYRIRFVDGEESSSRMIVLK